MEFIAAIPDYADDIPAKVIWTALESRLRDRDGIAYYKHPIIGSAGGKAPDLAILARDVDPIAVVCKSVDLQDLTDLQDFVWTVRNFQEGSYAAEADDFAVSLAGRFDRERLLRRRFSPIGVLALPLIGRGEFKAKFPDFEPPTSVRLLFAGEDPGGVVRLLSYPLSEQEWGLAKSVFQAAAPLTRFSPSVPTKSKKIGPAIKEMDKRIAQLDSEQNKVAVQIPPGPQRIRGLAGTGKTVLLAMRAANIHSRDPDAKILFTFHTNSLYGQARSLISRFFRYYNDEDPDWDSVQIRHGWGGKDRPGVYSDLCGRQGALPINFRDARSADYKVPFRIACQDALSREVVAAYDYVLVDEAQDFPREFFQLLYRLARPPRRIYWAYDSLQSLSSLEIPGPTELFGLGDDGAPLVSLEGTYPAEMEKDFILRKSYRCPRRVLMTAHAVGLGLYRDEGCIQMLTDADAWRSVGYDVVSGDFVEGSRIVVQRPPDSSPIETTGVYQGKQEAVYVHRPFPKRPDESAWVVESVVGDILREEVPPENVVVISLDPKNSKSLFSEIQSGLAEHEVPSTIPGFVDDSADFAMSGRVTLTTPYRAKGNEAPIVYLMCFDRLYEYGEEITQRNMAFTSISRAKGWVRISGSGRRMDRGFSELGRILEDIPDFKFTFPNLEHIRRLDAESSRRKREVSVAQESLKKLVTTDPMAVASAWDLETLSPEEKRRLKRLVDQLSDED